MSRTRVAVTGFGVISSLGRGPLENSSALRAGRSGIVSRRPEWADGRLRSQVSGKVDVEPLRELFDRKENRFLCDSALLAAVAMRDAVRHAELSKDQVEDPRSGLVLGTGAGASMPDAVALGDRLKQRGGSKVGAYQVPLIMGSSLTANLGVMFHIHGHSYCMTSACSTSAHTLMQGLDLIRSGRQDRVLLSRQDWRGPRAGWGKQDVGAWELKVDRAGAYDVTVRFEPAAKERTARLRWGENTQTQPVAIRAGSAQFTGVTWPAGPLRLEFTVEQGERLQGAQYVEIQTPAETK